MDIKKMLAKVRIAYHVRAERVIRAMEKRAWVSGDYANRMRTWHSMKAIGLYTDYIEALEADGF